MKRKSFAILFVLTLILCSCGKTENVATEAESEATQALEEIVVSTQHETQVEESEAKEEIIQAISTSFSSIEELEQAVGCKILLPLDEATEEQYYSVDSNGEVIAVVDFSCYDQLWILYIANTGVDLSNFDLDLNLEAFAQDAPPEEIDGEYPLTYFDSIENPTMSQWVFQDNQYVLYSWTGATQDDFFYVNDTIRNSIYDAYAENVSTEGSSGNNNTDWKTISLSNTLYNSLLFEDCPEVASYLYDGDLAVEDYDTGNIYFLQGTSKMLDSVGLYASPESDFGGSMSFKCKSMTEIPMPDYYSYANGKAYVCESTEFLTLKCERFTYDGATGLLLPVEYELIKDGKVVGKIDE